jgi:hypothetical protein
MADKIARGIVQTGDRLLTEIQARIRVITDALRALPFLRGKLVSVSLPNGDTVVTHSLGTAASFIIVRRPAACSIVESTNQGGIDPKNQVRITATGTAKGDLWFYPRASNNIPSGKTQA